MRYGVSINALITRSDFMVKLAVKTIVKAALIIKRERRKRCEAWHVE